MAFLKSRYLNMDPVEWLLEDGDPSIRYLTKKEITTDGGDPESYMKLFESPEITKFLQNNTRALGNIKNFDLFYKGPVWYFAEAVERGLDRRTDAVKNTAEYIMHASQTDAGGFTFNWQPPVAVGCRTGDMIRFLLRAGYLDERIQRGIGWITSTQRHDDGWLHCPLAGICDQIKLVLFNRSGNGLRREYDPGVASCYYATIACAMALIEYKKMTGSDAYNDRIQRAAKFFLRRSMYKTGRGFRVPHGSGWNSDFRLLGYPILSQYDILYGLIFIARAGRIEDMGAREAFNIIISKQNSDGTWNLESAHTGMLFGDARKSHIGRNNKWVTLNVLRLLSYMEY